jgi:serine phosphatase RsbU (regulator of sigma subunit)
MEVWGGNQGVERSFQTAGLGIWVYSRPYGEDACGGDVYYLSSCASGRITRMLLADVSGHGEVVSQLAGGLRDLMRRNINFVKQTRFVKAMNLQFTEYADKGCFATALVSTFFAPTGSFTLCNAGHPAPLVFRQAESQWSELTREVEESHVVTDIPFGIMDDVYYGHHEVRLQEGDMVLSYSDAIIESIDADGRQLHQAGVLELVRELDLQEPDKVIPAILERITGLSNNNLKQDDATILLCQATGSGPSLRNNLLAPFRFFGKVVDETRIG